MGISDRFQKMQRTQEMEWTRIIIDHQNRLKTKHVMWMDDWMEYVYLLNKYELIIELVNEAQN